MRVLITWAIMSLCVLNVNLAEAKTKEPKVDNQLLCLAKNIYYEAGLESREGMIAVEQVTLNRTEDDKFPKTVCGVVNQKTEISKPSEVVKATFVKGNFFKKEDRKSTRLNSSH